MFLNQVWTYTSGQAAAYLFLAFFVSLLMATDEAPEAEITRYLSLLIFFLINVIFSIKGILTIVTNWLKLMIVWPNSIK